MSTMTMVKTIQIVALLMISMVTAAIIAFYGAGAFIAVHFLKKVW